ncbi:uncharacterized protein LOC120251250 isoform X1 [Dioscorea cayenensis subsp. rotundata]|uniref:Uncharacterized protein LOC120251250 isoform X1 n=1 Tax=Dioscorea cayennensis subsp. rotundata TaxID=55577 RepID=A0AB40AL55_DIOCR|nr:uncharacterized protein LOC120251250 isoform X1 [Dioscorea cayenensis subsp. rotundata]XP_039115731.1 uncharacterized protein LOC120251250 isoform X1 [Dioscorea cayenensis subsp. rotundata]XP_039115732.1 uncharacterized protein LOC120251250 isoform X1 [Dioscorea cayenensis subsp. rotundata]
MARGKERTRLRSGRSEGRTSHAHSNIEGSNNTDSVPFSDANIPSVEETVHGIGSQQPNQNVVAVSDTQANYGSIQDASTIVGRLRVTVVNGLLEPSSKCARIITKKFKEKVDFEGYTWKTVSQPIRDFYFKEFWKHFI